MADAPDITHPHPSHVAKEVSEILAEYGPANSPQDLERLARGADGHPNNYDGGPQLARAVAAEFRRRAQDMRARGGGTLL